LSNNDHILLYHPTDKNKHVKIFTYEQWRDAQKKDEIAAFIYERHYRRYIKPFEFDDQTFRKEYKNGFAIMANCCLLLKGSSLRIAFVVIESKKWVLGLQS